MPKHRKPAPKKQRSVTARPVYRTKPDTEALAKALIHSILKNDRHDSNS